MISYLLPSPTRLCNNDLYLLLQPMNSDPRMVARTTRIHHSSRIKVMQTILARMIISACCRRRCPLSWLPIHDIFACFSILIHAECSYCRCCSRRPLSSSRCGGELLHLVSFVTALLPIHDVFACFSILIHAECSYRRCCSRRPLLSSRCGGELLHLVSFVTAQISTSITMLLHLCTTHHSHC